MSTHGRGEQIGGEKKKIDCRGNGSAGPLEATKKKKVRMVYCCLPLKGKAGRGAAQGEESFRVTCDPGSTSVS